MLIFSVWKSLLHRMLTAKKLFSLKVHVPLHVNVAWFCNH